MLWHDLKTFVKDGKISAKVVACSELVYTTKDKLLQVGNDVKQLQEA